MSERLPSLNALRAFEAVSRHGSIAHAAEELNVTAGAVSRMVKGLEDDLAIRLLDRDGRGIVLTQAAQDMAPQLQASFEQMRAAVSSLRRTSGERALSVAVEPVFASAWLVSRLDRFRQIAPSIDIRIDATHSEPDLSDSAIDIALGYGPADDSDRDQVKLIDEQIFAVCSPEALNRHGQIKSLEDFANHTLLHYEDSPESWLWPSWQRWLEELGVTDVDASRGLHMVAGQAIMEAARSGQGVALANTSIARDDLATGRLVQPYPASIKTDAGYVLTTRKDDRERADIAAFRDWLVAAIRVA
jgi:LysR family transcriptional regulator, glycine cleavage system transcriptional activator